MSTVHAGPEVEAERLLRQAHERVHRYPPGFPGFRASLRLLGADGSVSAGRVTLVPGAPAELEVEAAAGDRRWCADELTSMIAHRRHLPYAEADGRHPKRLVPGTAAEIAVGDGLDSRYTLEDGRIARITRTVDGARFSILVLDREEAPGQGEVSRRFAVAHWDAESGRLVRAEAYEDGYVSGAGVLLPASRRVATATDDGLVVRELRLAGHDLLAAPAGTAR